jgi:hypothetical protein
MADFVAHTARDRGRVLEHLEGFKSATFKSLTLGSVHLVNIVPPKDGYLLVNDLASVVTGLGLDRQPIDDNREGLLICYFGLLHLATIKDKLEIHTLKISYTFGAKSHGSDPLLSIVSVDDAGNAAHVFNSNIKAKSVLGSLKLIDHDFKTMLRVSRYGDSLKIIQI